MPYEKILMKAKGAFEAYTEAVGGVAFNGNPIPSGDELPEKQKSGWIAVVEYFTT